jgi:hypothetical protein
MYIIEYTMPGDRARRQVATVSTVLKIYMLGATVHSLEYFVCGGY